MSGFYSFITCWNHSVCPDHKVCHTCGKKAVANLDASVVKSQKVKGILALMGAGFQLPPIHGLVQGIEGVTEAGWLPFPLFARPCPTVPCHGFVDSRIVKSSAELKKVVEETIAADPEGEVLLMALIDSKLNTVWTPGLLSIGMGHDGATSGKDTLNIPINATWPPKGEGKVLKSAGIGEGEWPYIEAVVRLDGSTYLTQLRAGPKVKGAIQPDFIPHKVEVKGVVRPEGEDLLAWMEKVKTFSPGTVVYHPGGSLVDHFTVHCRTADVPCIMTFEPKVGDVLEPTKIKLPSPEAVLKGIIAGGKVKLPSTAWANAVYLGGLGLHHSAAMSGEAGKWIGMAAALICRMGSMALSGEARHLRSVHPKPPRQQVYRKAASWSLQRHYRRVRGLINIHRYGDFEGGAIGGIKWAMCGKATMELFNAIGELVRKPNDEGVKNLIFALNVAVNQAHNGGWWLNKFASAHEFDEVKFGDARILTSIAPFLLEMEGVYQGLTETQINTQVEIMGKWKVLTAEPPKPKMAEVFVSPILSLSGAITKGTPLSLGIKFEADLLGAKTKIIGLSGEVVGALINKVGDLRLRPWEQGYEIILLNKQGEEEVIWKEGELLK